MGTKWSALDAETVLDSDDFTCFAVDGTSKKVTVAALKATDGLGIDDKIQRWTLISTSDYTATPSTTSRIAVSDTSSFQKGLPIKYTYGGTTYYGIVDAISTNTYIDVAGPTLDVGADLTALYVGLPEMAVQIDFYISGAYGDGVADLLQADMSAIFAWRLPKAYLATFFAAHETVDTGANQPQVNVKIASSAVSTENGDKGPDMSGSTRTWVQNSLVAIDASLYDIEEADAIEISCLTAGSNGDAADLTVSCIFVME